MPDSPSQQDDGTRVSGGSGRPAASRDPLQYQRRTRRSSLQHSDIIEEISKQLSQKITDLQDETRLQRAVLNELATVNATLHARCRVLEKETGELWKEIFKVNICNFIHRIRLPNFDFFSFSCFLDEGSYISQRNDRYLH
jgi:hypothetical protein